MQIQKVGDISYREFMTEFYEPGIPVVFKNASKAWKANGLFTPSYFREHFGDRKTSVNGDEYTMSELLDLVENSSTQTPAPYPCIYSVTKQLPELMELISPLGMNYAVPNWFESHIFPLQLIGSGTELFLGGPGGKYQTLHIDFYHTNAWITQLYGDKNFIIFPRGQDKYLYPNRNNEWISDVNWHTPDYEKHPEFKHATPIVVRVNQGETIFIPDGLWHTAEALSTSISVIFDQINAKNFDRWRSDVWNEKKEANKLKALAILLYVSMAKKYCQLGDLFGVKRDRYQTR